MGNIKIFDDKEGLQNKIDEYFEVMEKCNRPLTITGLCYFLGTNRMSLLNFRNRDPEINEIVMRAKDRIEVFVEEQLFTNPRSGAIIFNLKNNFHGWSDKQEISVNTGNQNLLAELSTSEIRELLQEETSFEVIEPPTD